MTTDVLSVPVDATLKEATQYLQSVPRDRKGKVSYIYVVDQNQRLEGVIQVRDLVFYSPDTPVRQILKSPVVQVETQMTQIDVARLLERHRYLALPVVDKNQRLVGVISADVAMPVFEEEAAKDIARMIGTSAEEMRTRSVRQVVRLRLPWLLVNIVSGLACAAIAGIFQNDVPTVAALFLFVPVVLSLSESTGVQSATIVVRSIEADNSDFKALIPLFVREVAAGVLIGVICGSLVGWAASYWQSRPVLGVAIAGSMAIAIIISAAIGMVLPFLFKRLKIDPAIASGPLVLAICDLQTLAVYFNFAGWMIKSAH